MSGYHACFILRRSSLETQCPDCSFHGGTACTVDVGIQVIASDYKWNENGVLNGASYVKLIENKNSSHNK
jgi:hypothetical protein